MITSPPRPFSDRLTLSEVDGGVFCLAVAIHTNDLLHVELARAMPMFVEGAQRVPRLFAQGSRGAHERAGGR